MSTTRPRNVIYYNDGSNPIPLAGISDLPYTDVILTFLVPGADLNLVGQGGAFGSAGNPDPADIQALQTPARMCSSPSGAPRRASRPVLGSSTPRT